MKTTLKLCVIIFLWSIITNVYSQTRQDYIGEWECYNLNVWIWIKSDGNCEYEYYGVFKKITVKGEWDINKSKQLVIKLYDYPPEYFELTKLTQYTSSHEAWLEDNIYWIRGNVYFEKLEEEGE